MAVVLVVVVLNFYSSLNFYPGFSNHFLKIKTYFYDGFYIPLSTGQEVFSFSNLMTQLLTNKISLCNKCHATLVSKLLSPVAHVGQKRKLFIIARFWPKIVLNSHNSCIKSWVGFFVIH